MSDWLLVTLTVLAVHRATRLIVADRILERPRIAIQNWFENRWELRGRGDTDPDEWQSAGAYLLSCLWCMSIWIGGAIVLAVDLTVGLPAPVLVWAAASSVTGLLARVEG